MDATYPHSFEAVRSFVKSINSRYVAEDIGENPGLFSCVKSRLAGPKRLV